MFNNNKSLLGNRGQHHEMSLFGKKRGVRRVIPPQPPRQPLQFPKEKEVIEFIVGNNTAEDDARLKAEEEARLKAEEEARLQAEEEARLKAEEEARIKAEEEARIKAEEEARIKAEEEARLKAEDDARLKAEEEARIKAEEEARIKAEEEAKLALELEQKSEPNMEEVYEEPSVSPGENLLSANLDLSKATEEISENPGSEEEVMQKIEEEEIENINV